MRPSLLRHLFSLLLKSACLVFCGQAIASTGMLVKQLNLSEAIRPIDDFEDYNSLIGNEQPNDAVSTLQDQLQLAGNFPLARALLVDRQTDFLGLSTNLNSFEVSTLETPIGGNFTENTEEELQFRKPLFNRKSRFDSPATLRFPRNRSIPQRSQFFNRSSRFDRVTVFDGVSRFQARRAQQRALIKTYR